MKCFIDVPTGWRYGFPKVFDTEKDGDMMDWIVNMGYPKAATLQPYFYIRQWEAEHDAEMAFANWQQYHQLEQYNVQKEAFKAGWDAAMEHAAP